MAMQCWPHFGARLLLLFLLRLVTAVQPAEGLFGPRHIEAAPVEGAERTPHGSLVHVVAKSHGVSARERMQEDEEKEHAEWREHVRAKDDADPVSSKYATGKDEAFGWERAKELAKEREELSKRRGHKARYARKKEQDKEDKAHENGNEDTKDESRKGGDETGEVMQDVTEKLPEVQPLRNKVTHAHTDISADWAKDASAVFRNFLPGWSPNERALMITGPAIAIAMLWFFTYFAFFYRHDRGESDGKDESGPRLSRAESQVFFGMLSRGNYAPEEQDADIVLVFHNPTCRDDGDEDVSAEALNVLLGPRAPARKMQFERVRALVGALPQGGLATKRSLRAALLQDLFMTLPGMGFDVGLFKSICGAELYMTVNLKKKEWIEHYLMRQHKELQIRRDVVQALGVGDTPIYSASSPPFIRFNPWIVTHLRDRKIIGEEDPRGLFVTAHSEDPSHDSIETGTDRIRIIFKHLVESIDVDAAKRHGLIRDWYPVHSLSWVRRLAVTWANFSLLRDFKIIQPIHYINNYFGTRVAFAFAWNGLYCKVLLALLPVALVWELTTRIFAMRQVMAFSVVVIVWSKIAVNLWEREEKYLMEMWNDKNDKSESIVRPEFKGTLQQSPLDANQHEARCSSWEAQARKLVSGLVTLIFCMFVVLVIYFWVSINYSNSKGFDLVASLLLVIQIKVFEIIFNHLAERLTEWENHKYQSAEYDSYLWKQFIFQFVNNYTAFFYLAVKQRFTEAGCPVGGCLAILRRELSVALVVLSAARIAEVLIASLMVRYRLYNEQKKMNTMHAGSPPMRSFVEEQSKYTSFRLREQIEMMLQLTISLGYVILFGGVAPIIIPFCFTLFVVQLRASAFLLVTGAKRAFPRRSLGIGPWRQVVRLLMNLGVVFAGVLLVLYGDMFREAPLITRLSGILMFCCSMLLALELVTVVIPTDSKEASVLAHRRMLVENKIMEQISESEALLDEKSGRKGEHLQESASLTKAFEDLRIVEAVTSGKWDLIPTVNDRLTEQSQAAGVPDGLSVPPV